MVTKHPPARSVSGGRAGGVRFGWVGPRWFEITCRHQVSNQFVAAGDSSVELASDMEALDSRRIRFKVPFWLQHYLHECMPAVLSAQSDGVGRNFGFVWFAKGGV